MLQRKFSDALGVLQKFPGEALHTETTAPSPKSWLEGIPIAISRHASSRGGLLFHALRLLEIATALVRFDHVARIIVNTNHSAVGRIDTQQGRSPRC
jgi:hypothetical protein